MSYVKYMCSWIGIRTTAKCDVLDHLGLVETGQMVRPGHRQKPMSCHLTKRGWLIIAAEDVRWATWKRVIDLSCFGTAVGVEFADFATHSSFVRAAEYGSEQWSVSHASRPAHRLVIEGDLPPEAEAMRDRYLRYQKSEGFWDRLWDGPPEIARAVTGYRVDKGETDFVALAHSRGLLSRIASRIVPGYSPSAKR